MRRINLEMQLTLRCQISCPNCNRLIGRLPDQGTQDDMSTEQVLRFVNQIANSPVKVKRLKLLGGEPLLHPQFDKVYLLLAAAVGEGLIQKVKIESNGILPRPDVPPCEGIHWAGKPFSRKRHLPACWSPTDLQLPTPNAPCSMPRICGVSLDAYGYSLCSVCSRMLSVFEREDLYVDKFPADWRNAFAETIEKMCPHCIFSAPQDFKDKHCYPLNETPPEALTATRTWQDYLDDFDGHAKKEKW